MSCVHSRAGRGPSFGSKLPRSELVPPLPFLTTSAVCSAGHPAGLLHPATGHGVRRVSGLPLPFARRLQVGLAFPVAHYPSKLFPPQQRVARHRVPLPSRRCSRFLAVVPPVLPRLAPRPSTVHSTSGLCSAAKSVASPTALPLTDRPMLPWACSHAVHRCVIPLPLRGLAVGWPLCDPKVARGLAGWLAPL